MKRFWEKKLTPLRVIVPLFPSQWCFDPPPHNGVHASRTDKKKFRLSRTRAESNPQLPRPLCGPDSSSFFHRFYFFPSFHANNSYNVVCVCGTVIVRAVYTTHAAVLCWRYTWLIFWDLFFLLNELTDEKNYSFSSLFFTRVWYTRILMTTIMTSDGNDGDYDCSCTVASYRGDSWQAPRAERGWKKPF